MTKVYKYTPLYPFHFSLNFYLKDQFLHEKIHFICSDYNFYLKDQFLHEKINLPVLPFLIKF